MKLSKSIARKLVFPFLYRAGFDKLKLSRTKTTCLIVNFHGVTNVSGNSFNNRHLPEKEFEKLLIYFKKNFKIVPLSELFNIHRSNTKTDQKTIALTFDDGYENNFSVALPLLKKHNIPATFYLISRGLTDDNFYVWPDIIDLILKNVKEDIKLDVGTFNYPGFYSTELKRSLTDFLKSAGKKRDQYIVQLAEKYPFYKAVAKKYPQLIDLIRKENFKKYLNEPLIEYGSHTDLHYNLEFLNAADCENELAISKKIIEEQSGQKVISLAFPDGSYNKETLRIASELGYTDLTAVDYKFGEANNDPNLLSRFTISNSTTFESNVFRLAKQFDKYGF